MIAVIFEVHIKEDKQTDYLDFAALLRPKLDDIDGFISIERFQSFTTPNKILSLSFWQDEEAIKKWRNLSDHRNVQTIGREHIFEDYTISVASVIRNYGKNLRVQTPNDSLSFHE